MAKEKPEKLGLVIQVCYTANTADPNCNPDYDPNMPDAGEMLEYLLRQDLGKGHKPTPSTKFHS